MPRMEAGEILLSVFSLQFSTSTKSYQKGGKKVHLFISHLIFFFMCLGRMKGANLYVYHSSMIHELATENRKASQKAYLKTIHPLGVGAKDISNTHLLIYLLKFKHLIGLHSFLWMKASAA